MVSHASVVTKNTLTGKIEQRAKMIFFLPSLIGGGAENITLKVIEGLNTQKYSITLIVVDSENAELLKKVPNNVNLIFLGEKRVRKAFFKSYHLIKKQKPDIIFSSIVHLNLLLVFIKIISFTSNFKLILRETTIISKAYERNYNFKMLISVLYNFANVLICQSNEMKRDLVENFYVFRPNIKVINNPVDFEEIRKRGEIGSHPVGFDAEKTNLISVGRLSPEKGHDILFRSLALMNSENIHLYVLGSGPNGEYLEELSKELGLADRVHFLGFQDNPYFYMKNADALVLSSHYEGFPNVVLEALACGTPVISTPAIGGVVEIIGEIPECIISNEINEISLSYAISEWCSGDRSRVPLSRISHYEKSEIIGKFEQVFSV